MAIRFDPDPNLESELARATEIHAYLEELAAAAAETARQLAPYRTGALRDSIDYEVTSEGSGQIARVIVGDWKANLVEYGTSRHPARPYLRPAIEAEVGPLRDDGLA